MPNSNDNQDYSPNDQNDKISGNPQKATGPAMGDLPLSSKEDENNFTSDDQKGKKVDGDPEKESDKPAEQ